MDKKKRDIADVIMDHAPDFEGLLDLFNIGSMKRDPAVRVTKGTAATMIEIDVPGCARENVRIDLDVGILRVEWIGLGGEGVREFRIDRRADADNISATVTNGFMKIIIPILDGEKPRKIEIK